MTVKLRCTVLMAILLIGWVQTFSKTKISLATFNIRVDTKNDSLNPWNIRKNQNVNFLDEQRLDIICLQELRENQYEYISKSLDSYNCFRGLTSKKKGAESLCIYYQKDRFKCLDKGTFWLSEHPDSIGLKGWNAGYPRCAVWVVLEDVSSRERCVVVNTHLDHISRAANKNGMDLIKTKIKKLAEELPVILVGDMNTSEGSETYRRALKWKFKLYDAYHIARKRKGVNYTYHQFGKIPTDNNQRRGDMIFVTDDVKVNKMFAPKEKSIDGVFMSDHCPVIVNMTIG